ncbi:nuclear receptor subfamily 0, group B, member 2b [Aplochiton taeniatus]
MFPLKEKKTANCHCPGHREQHPHTILYNILCQKDSSYQSSGNLSSNRTWTSCHCEQRRAVCLKNPQNTCQAASSVLVKTVRFMRSLPSFSQLPSRDRQLLLRDCWVPLFILGLAQEKVVFEVTDTADSSMLRQILLNDQDQSGTLSDEKRTLPTIAGVHNLKSCLHQLWALDLSPKEYAYLKGALLFKPDVKGLTVSAYIEGLQQEAQGVLQEVILTLHPGDWDRFSRIFLAACTILTVNHLLVTELFFKPVIGDANLFDFLSEMLFIKPDYN